MCVFPSTNIFLKCINIKRQRKRRERTNERKKRGKKETEKKRRKRESVGKRETMREKKK